MDCTAERAPRALRTGPTLLRCCRGVVCNRKASACGTGPASRAAEAATSAAATGAFILLCRWVWLRRCGKSVGSVAAALSAVAAATARQR